MPSPALWRPVTRRALRVERLAEPDCGRCFCIWTRPATLDFQRLTISQQISDLPTAYEQLQPPVGHLNIEGVQQYCDVSTGALRPLVPKDCRYSIFKALHNISHHGI